MGRGGVVYYIGSRRRSCRWQNPGETGHISVNVSSMDAKCLADDFEAMNRDPFPIGYSTDPADRTPSVSFDLHGRSVVPTHYTLRHPGLDGVCCLRNWRLEASDDGQLWVPLRIHRNDTALTRRGDAKTWPIVLNPTLRGPFRSFRIVGTGLNSSGNSQMCISGFEVYGSLKERVMPRLTFNIYDASMGLELSSDGESWVKSVGGEPIRKGKSASKDLRGSSKAEAGLDADADGRPTVVRCAKSTQWVTAKSVQAFTSGRHYFAFRILKLPRKKKAAESSSKKRTAVISVGVVPASFDMARANAVALGKQGSWGYNDRGYKTSGGKKKNFGCVLSKEDTVGVELDIECKTMRFFVNDVPQGLAFTDVTGHSAYHAAVSLRAPDARVCLLGSMRRPPSRSPQNRSWFNTVLRTGRAMQAFAPAPGKSRSLLPFWFVRTLARKAEKLGVGSAERALPKGVPVDEIDEKTRLSKADVVKYSAHLSQDRVRRPNGRKRRPHVSFDSPDEVELTADTQFSVKFDRRRWYARRGAPPCRLCVLRKDASMTPDIMRKMAVGPFCCDVQWGAPGDGVAPECPPLGPLPFGVYELGICLSDGQIMRSGSFEVSSQHPSAYLHLLYDAAQFSLDADAQLVRCVDRICDKKSSKASAHKLKASEFEPGSHLIHYKLLEGRTVAALRTRLLTLQLLNERVSSLLPMLDFSVKPGVSPLTDSVRALRRLIFWSTKHSLWERALEATQAGGPSLGTVKINRFKANRLRDKGKCDVRGTRSCFGQLFRLINRNAAVGFRVGTGQRAWRTVFLGEGGVDAGGLYRELLFCMCKELQSPQLPLFILCPNGREQIGQNRDKWVPRPSSVSPLLLSMFEFLGKLMGLAIRTKSLLSMDLPSIVWKALIGAPIEEADVVAIDRLSFKLIEFMASIGPRHIVLDPGAPSLLVKGPEMRVCEPVPDSYARHGVRQGMRLVGIGRDAGSRPVDVTSADEANAMLVDCARGSAPYVASFARRMSPDQFDRAVSENKFVIVGSDQKERELVPGGRDRSLTWSNRHEFCQRIVEYRKNEFKPQCAAMRRGLACVVPYALLSLFTWGELETQVCGRATMNVDLLQKMTRYSGCGPSDRHIQFFWQIMRDRFDEMEKAKFLKFVWGRARLPVRAADFEVQFKINGHPASARNPDAYMPIGHTCFFSIDMPAYTSIDTMHKRILYAITHCEAIDADYGPESIQAVRDDDSDDDEA